jgi:hypothetical protein
MCNGKGPDKQPVREAKVNKDTVMFFQNLKMTVERFRTKILFSDEATLQMPRHGNRNNAKMLRPAIRRQ